jgi:toxin-antitoxin system PIN domain toxin
VIIPDVNVLVYAARPATPEQVAIRAWLEQALAGTEPVGLSELVLSGVVRVLTNSRVFVEPLALDDALAFTQALGEQPNVVRLRPGPRHWSLFTALAVQGQCRGNLVADAYHAALVTECGGTWYTTDRDFARFPGLRWRHPLR